MAGLLRRMVASYRKGWKPDRQLQHELDSWRLVTATSWRMHGPSPPPSTPHRSQSSEPMSVLTEGKEPVVSPS